MNGAPLRLVVPGWPGSCSQKWLTRVRLRDRVYDGAKMTGTSYRVPARPLAPGEQVDETAFVIIEAMPVKSLITHPATGTRTANRKLEARGHAWAGERTVSAVRLSIDFGATWIVAALDRASECSRLAELARLDRVSGTRILRDLGQGDGFGGRRPAPRHRLEPEGLPQQRAPSGRGHGGLGGLRRGGRSEPWCGAGGVSYVPASRHAVRESRHPPPHPGPLRPQGRRGRLRLRRLRSPSALQGGGGQGDVGSSVQSVCASLSPARTTRSRGIPLIPLPLNPGESRFKKSVSRASRETQAVTVARHPR